MRSDLWKSHNSKIKEWKLSSAFRITATVVLTWRRLTAEKSKHKTGNTWMRNTCVLKMTWVKPVNSIIIEHLSVLFLQSKRLSSSRGEKSDHEWKKRSFSTNFLGFKVCFNYGSKYGHRAQTLRDWAELVHVGELFFLKGVCDATGLVADKVPCLYGLNPLKLSWQRVTGDLVEQETQWP